MKRLYNMRWTLVRRALQLAVLGLFGHGAPGGRSRASLSLTARSRPPKLPGTIPLSDPLALLERLAAGHMPTLTAGLGALIVLVLYSPGLAHFCGWICPMNMVAADAAEWLRVRLSSRPTSCASRTRSATAFAAAPHSERRHGHGRLRGGEPAGLDLA